MTTETLSLLADLPRRRAGGVDAIVLTAALDQAEAVAAEGLLGAVLLRAAGGLARPTDALPVIRAVGVIAAVLRAHLADAVRDRCARAGVVFAFAGIFARLADLLLRTSEEEDNDRKRQRSAHGPNLSRTGAPCQRLRRDFALDERRGL